MDDIHNARFTNPPMLFAATCNFLRWDTPDESGAETLFFNENGIIGAIAATRPVYIGLNERMCKALASAISATVGAGRRVPIGELLQNAKTHLFHRPATITNCATCFWETRPCPCQTPPTAQ